MKFKIFQTTSIKANIISNFIGNGWGAFLSIFFVPIYLKYIGAEGYGLIGIFASLQVVLSLLDSGLSTTLNKEIARLNDLIKTKEAEAKQKLLDIQGTYKVTYGNQQNVDKNAVSKTESDLNDLFKYAISKGFITKEEAQRIREIGLKQAQSEVKAAGDAGNCGGPANQKLLHKAMELQHIQQHLTAVIHNADVEYTRYSNFNQKLGTKAGKISSVEDDIADGVRTPCYSSPHHNPGYSKSVDKNGCVSITPTNQNPSHIKSHKPDLIKNFKDED